jgi:hypothetical protein
MPEKASLFLIVISGKIIYNTVQIRERRADVWIFI